MDAFRKQEKISRAEHEEKLKEKEAADRRLKEIAEKKKQEREAQESAKEAKITEITDDEAEAMLQKMNEKSEQKINGNVLFSNHAI